MANPWDNDEVVGQESAPVANTAPVATAPANAAANAAAPWENDDVQEQAQPVNYEAGAAAIKDAIEQGNDRAMVEKVAWDHGIDPNSLSGVDAAIAFRKKQGSYGGEVRVARPEGVAPLPAQAPLPHEDKGILNATAVGALDTVSLGLSDEGGAAIGAIGNTVAGVFGGGSGEGFGDYYSRVRDENRQELTNAEADHPLAFGAGQVAGGLASLPFGGGAASLGRVAVQGAVNGAAYGFGSADGDLGSRIGGAARGGVVGGLGSAALGGLARAVTPRVSGAVRRLLDAEVPLTPGQLMQGGNRVSAWVGRNLEDAAKSAGPLSTWATSAADRRGATALNRAVADTGLARTSGEKMAARILEGDDSTKILNRAISDAAGLDDSAARQARQFLDARAAGLNPSFRDPNLARQAADALDTVDFLRATPGGDLGRATATDLFETARRRAGNGETLPAEAQSLVDDAGRIMGASSVFDQIGGRLSPSAERLAKLAIGGAGYYGSAGATIPLDIAVAALYSPVGQRLAQRALTGGIRRGADAIGPRVLNPAMSDYASRQTLVPNIDEVN